MNPSGLSDSLTGATENAGQCERCGATARMGEGICVNCLLREGLAAEGEASTEVDESVLAEANVPDKQWRLGNYEILEEIGGGGMGVIFSRAAAPLPPHRRREARPGSSVRLARDAR